MALIDAADSVVLGDTLQYSRQSFQNRALVRTPQGRQWLSIPLEGGQHGRPIHSVSIRGKDHWIRKHRRALHFNYRSTPFFNFYERDLDGVLGHKWDCLGDLTCASVQVLAGLYGIDTSIARASRMVERPNTVPDIAAGFAGRFLSSDDTVAVDRGLIDVHSIVHVDDFEYRQNFEGFEAGLSALDLLLNYGPEALSMLRRAARVARVG